MENQATPMQLGDENFNKLMIEVNDAFRKYNPPINIAITGIFYVVAEVSQRNNIPIETLQSALSEVYDNIGKMLKQEAEAKQEVKENTN